MRSYHYEVAFAADIISHAIKKDSVFSASLIEQGCQAHSHREWILKVGVLVYNCSISDRIKIYELVFFGVRIDLGVHTWK